MPMTCARSNSTGARKTVAVRFPGPIPLWKHLLDPKAEPLGRQRKCKGINSEGSASRDREVLQVHSMPQDSRRILKTRLCQAIPATRSTAGWQVTVPEANALPLWVFIHQLKIKMPLSLCLSLHRWLVSSALYIISIDGSF